ncbi:MAG: hypothetical protein Q8904_09295 [Bacteroidota bacterium]|nr:hypothetical protein [Bacteroidota bacterium]
MASLIKAMNPVFISFFAALNLKEKLTPGKIIGTRATLAGAYEILREVHEVGAIRGILYRGIVATAVPNLLWKKSLSIIEANICSLFYPIQLLVSVLLVINLLNEKANMNFGIEATLIVEGVMYALLSERKRAKKEVVRGKR